jgi:hypothetical protein
MKYYSNKRNHSALNPGIIKVGNNEQDLEETENKFLWEEWSGALFAVTTFPEPNSLGVILHATSFENFFSGS